MLKKILLGVLLLFGVLISISVIIVTFFEEEVAIQLIGEINKSLDKPIQVEELDLSLVKGFPYASATLNNVLIPDAFGDTLLSTKELSFKFGLMSLFRKSYDIKSVAATDGKLFIKYNKKNKANFDIFQTAPSTETDTATSNFNLNLKEAIFNAILLHYEDESLGHIYRFDIKNGRLEGQFSTTQFDIISNAQLHSQHIKIGDNFYLQDKDIAYEAKLNIDSESGRYGFEDVKCTIESNPFSIQGAIISKDKHTDYDLVIDGKDCTVQSLLKILPASYIEYLGDFKSTGDFVLRTSIKGRSSKKENPAMSVVFGLKKGSIKSPRLNSPIKNVNFTAQFSNGKERSNKKAVFEIMDFKGKMQGEPINLQLRLTDIDHPIIDINFNGNIALESVYKLFGNPLITDAGGIIKVKDFAVKGKYDDMLSSYAIAKVKTKGDIYFEDAALTLNKQTMTIESGNVHLDDNDLRIKDLQIKGADSDLLVSGNFKNLFPVLFADEANTKKAELKFNAKLKSENLNVNNLLKFSSIAAQEGKVSSVTYDSLKVKQTQNRERITKFLDGNIDIQIDQFSYKKIQAKDIKGLLDFENNQLEIDSRANSMHGKIVLNSTVHFEKETYLEAKIITEDINLSTFFKQSENFGQEVMTDQNIRGDMNSKIFIKAHWDEQGNYMDDKLYVLADLNCSKGELKNFKLLESFSSFISSKDLSHIRFTNLQNYLEVKKGGLFIPAMFIQNNAMNMTVAGTHTFSGKIDYQIKVNAGQTLWNKIMKKPGKTVKAKNGWINLYYSVKGTMDDFKYEQDRKKVLRKFDRTERHRKRMAKEIANIFGDEINLIEEPPEVKDEEDITKFLDFDDEEDDGDEYIDFD